MQALEGVDYAARISECGSYRYTLERRWDFGDGTCVFLMLNPSTADAIKDDPTIRRCIRFSQGWGYEALVVLNLFAFRTSSPIILKTVRDPVGPDNDITILEVCESANLIVCAWGASGRFQRRDAEVTRMLELDGHELYCLGTLKEGHPIHPLARGKRRVPDGTQPVRFYPTRPTSGIERRG